MPKDTSDYHPGQTLRVLVGTRTGSGDGYGQQAFFFVDGRYIGTDTKDPSAHVKVTSQSDTEVTLAYPLPRPRPAVLRQRRADDGALPAEQRSPGAAGHDPTRKLKGLSRHRARLNRRVSAEISGVTTSLPVKGSR